MALQSLDITRRSATTPSPSQRQTRKVAKLIDVTKCIGCKACQVACMEWNDTRDAIGANHGVLDNPAGVDGTHVMYVLHHADKPEMYNGLPGEPTIGPLVDIWKGVAKPLASLALAMVTLGAFFHYVTKGPNEVSKEIEK